MKLILAIVRAEQGDHLVESLVARNYRVTTLATTGGFLKQGNTTLLVGVEDEQVEAVLGDMKNASGEEDGRTRGIAFVLNASQVERL